MLPSSMFVFFNMLEDVVFGREEKGPKNLRIF